MESLRRLTFQCVTSGNAPVFLGPFGFRGSPSPATLRQLKLKDAHWPSAKGSFVTISRSLRPRCGFRESIAASTFHKCQIRTSQEGKEYPQHATLSRAHASP